MPHTHTHLAAIGLASTWLDCAAMTSFTCLVAESDSPNEPDDPRLPRLSFSLPSLCFAYICLARFHAAYSSSSGSCIVSIITGKLGVWGILGTGSSNISCDAGAVIGIGGALSRRPDRFRGFTGGGLVGIAGLAVSRALDMGRGGGCGLLFDGCA